jgi:hypothetical protein
MHCGIALGSVDPPKEQPASEEKALDLSGIKKLDFEIHHPEANVLTIGEIVGQDKIGLSKRPSSKSETGDPVKDSINLCRPSKGVDIKDIRGKG